MKKLINFRLIHWVPVIGLIPFHFSDSAKTNISTKQDLIYYLFLSILHGISTGALVTMIFF